MKRNVIIGVLVVGIIILGGFYLSKNKAGYQEENTAGQKQTPVSKTPSTPAPKPDAPVVVTSANTSVSSSTAVVTGQVKPNGSSSSYWYEYGETTALGNRTVSQQIGSGFSLLSTPAFITGLRATTVYYFRLSAKNGFATVNGNTYSFQTNNNPPPNGSAPTTRTNNATAVSRTTANINGEVNPNGSQTNFWFEYGKDNNLGYVTVFQSAGNSNSTTTNSISISGLEPLTKYYFRMNAQNQFGTVNGSIQNFTTSGPAAPSAPTVTTTSASNVTSSGARFNGRIEPNASGTNYWFEYSQNSLLGTLINTGTSIETVSSDSGSTDVNSSVTGLSKDTTYYYRLVGRNAYGTVNGSIVSFKTKN